MTIKNSLKVVSTILPLTLTSINGRCLDSTSASALFEDAYTYYRKNSRSNDPRTLGRLEIKLKRVIEAKDVSEQMLAYCAKLFLFLGCNSSYNNTLKRMHLPTYSEYCCSEAFRLYYKYAKDLNPKTLNIILVLLERVKEDSAATAEDLANAAYLAFQLDFSKLYLQLVDTLFHGACFNPRLYKEFVKKIRPLKVQKEAERQNNQTQISRESLISS